MHHVIVKRVVALLATVLVLCILAFGLILAR